MWTGVEFADDLWQILERCLAENAPSRPGSAEVVRFMESSNSSAIPKKAHLTLTIPTSSDNTSRPTSDLSGFAPQPVRPNPPLATHDCGDSQVESPTHSLDGTEKVASRRDSQPGVTPLTPSEYLQRQIFQRLPQMIYSRSNAGTPTSSEPSSDTERLDAISTSEACVNKTIADCIQHFFSIRNVKKAENSFRTLPSAYHCRLIEQLVFRAIQSTQVDAQLAADLFTRLARARLCSPAAFEEGFRLIAGMLDDIVIDAPEAYYMMATMMKGSGMGGERCARLADRSMDKHKLLRLLVGSTPLPSRAMFIPHVSDSDESF
jgi:hypothetical protein